MEKRILITKDEADMIKKYLGIIRQQDIDRVTANSQVYYSLGEIGKLEKDLS